MSNLTLSAERESLAYAAGVAVLVNGVYRTVKPHASPGDSVIIIHLGPGQRPEVANILRSQWPTVTALNYAQEREFHVRLRRHKGTGIFIVYASVGFSDKNRSQKSIFGDILQRGRVALTPAQIKAGIEEIRAELGIERQGILGT